MLRFVSIVILILAIAVYIYVFPSIWENREAVRASTPAGYIIPSKFSRILAMGNQGVLSDFLFLKTSTFVGGRRISGHDINEEDWNFVVRSLNVVTDLDPYFNDPYVLAEGLLAWDAGMVDEANKLLKKGMMYRNSDWWLPFYVGFNYFHFLNDMEQGAEFIMQASALPGSPGYLKTLAARLAYYGGKSKTAVLFLQGILAETNDPVLKKRLALRLSALECAVIIEDALAKYRLALKSDPTSLQDLVTQGYLIELPDDPYGGEWVILKNGRVFSTSRFAERKSKK